MLETIVSNQITWPQAIVAVSLIVMGGLVAITLIRRFFG